ncbi:hypothetical protein [Streptomyces sp. NBC_00233]|uniref:hypothetical protein n=1 Tax=Streptomyces sp. NBC_00233 TaxID=2975686 RepID=UPI00224EC6A3|nr:hypothetical protein [Streptomyces sp. NBC_00233]MCX5233206.1 hypothetical protein [Streptomyces sp. NBC_00233]
MNAVQQSPQGPGREELSRLLPAPADPDLSPGRHRLLKEHLMNHVQEESRLAARRWRLATRFAAPVALAAAVASAAVSIGQTSGNADTAVVAAGPERIANVAYTLDQEPDSVVKMSMRVEGGEMNCVNGNCTVPESGPEPTKVVADPAELQHDLDRMGVNARVYRDDPGCTVDQRNLKRDHDANRAAVGKIEREGDRLVTVIHRDKIPDGSTLVVVLPSPNGKDLALFGLDVLKGELPSCYHAQKEELS